jgi:hypothetical protein
MTLRLTLVAEKTDLSRFADLQLFAQFENRGKKPLSAVINATPLSHGDYTVEIRDALGRPPDLERFGMCGTMAPLLEHEIFVVEPGATHRQHVYSGAANLPAGAYKARVTYTAQRSDHGRESWTPVVKQRIEVLWTGTLVTEWLPFTIRPVS